MPVKVIYQHVITDPGGTAPGLIEQGELEAAIAQTGQLFQAKEDDCRQIVQLYNATVIDGRFIGELATDPKSVAAKLGLELSDSASMELIQAGIAADRHFKVQPQLPIAIIAIVIVVFIVVNTVAPPEVVVIDSSGLIKL